MAAATKRLGVVATMSTSFYPPFLLARLSATVDHIARGRFGWSAAVLAEPEHDLAWTLLSFWIAPFFANTRSERRGMIMIRDGLAMRHGKDLTWAQVLMAANTPMLLKAGLVEGNTEAGVLASGQVAGIIEDLPSCAELVETIIGDAIKHLQAAAAFVE